MDSEERLNILVNLVACSTNFLRQVFKYCWKEAIEEKWEDSSIEELVNDLNAPIINQAQSLRNVVLNCKPIEEWDMSTLCQVLLEFQDIDKVKNKGNVQYIARYGKYDKANRSISSLQNLRTELPTMELEDVTMEFYEATLEEIKACWKNLGMKQEHIDNSISEMEADTCLNQLKIAKQLFARAARKKTAANKGNIQHAERIYTKVINTPSILPVNLGMAYEKRSVCYLRMIKEDILIEKKTIDLALNDALKAMKLNELSSIAQRLVGKCYEWKGNLPKAIHHFERSLELDPSQRRIEADMENCKRLLMAEVEEYPHSPALSFLNLKEDGGERVDNVLEVETPESYVENGIVNGRDHSEDDVPGEVDFILGNLFLAGKGGRPKNFNKGVEHLRLAEAKNHAEAMYLLALCYVSDLPVKKDPAEAIRRLKLVATMDIDSPGNTTLYRCNSGVAAAQRTLGHIYCFREGENNFRRTVFWLEKAVENGDGWAAYSLGYLYREGHGVVRNVNMAEMCWKESLLLGFPMASAPLLNHFLKELEPSRAVFVYRIRRHVETLPKISNDEFDDMVCTTEEAIRDHEEILNYFDEKESFKVKCISTKLMFSRKDHFTFLNDPCRRRTILEKNCYLVQASDRLGSMFLTPSSLQKTLKRNVKTYSKTVALLEQTVTIWLELANLLDEKEEFTEIEHLHILNLAFHLLQQGLRFVPVRNIDYCKLSKIIGTLMAKRTGKRDDFDMRLILCSVAFTEFDWTTSVAFESASVFLIYEGILNYPTIPAFYTLFLIILNILGEYGISRRRIQEGLKNHPDNLELLYLYTVYSSEQASTEKSIDECMENFEKYLRLAPEDDPSVPDVFYSIAGLYLQKLEGEVAPRSEYRRSMRAKVIEYFQRGVEAETRQLPCFLPYRTSAVRNRVERTVISWKRKEIVTTRRMESILERLIYLKSWTRRGLIKMHRQNLERMIAHQMKPDRIVEREDSVKFEQIMDTSLMEPIFLEEINFFTDNHIFEDCVLQLTIIEEPFIVSGKFLASVAQDAKGDVIRVHVYDFEKEDDEIAEMFSVGRVIVVMNPHFSINIWDLLGCIQIDDLNFVIFQQRREKLCRFCWKGKSALKCFKCKRPYCSKECKTLDLQRHGHDLICSTVE